MRLTFILFVLTAGAEVGLWLPILWRYRQPFSLLLVFIVTTSCVVMGLQLRSSWVAIFLVLGGYRIINLLRITKNRTQPDYLFHSARRSSLVLISIQALVLGTARLSQHLIALPALGGWYILVFVQVVVAFLLVTVTLRQLRAAKPPVVAKAIPQRDLPSLTVAIPARNETDDLEACLASLLKSTYPKLEVIVLDDCSQNARTPEIIRGLAHAGVRFISGIAPPEHWLAKNYAYVQLAQQASGDILLFCGVDSRFEPDSLSNLVRIMLQENKQMLSILPRNTWPRASKIEPMLLQPARYAWELAVPRDWSRRPPVLSTCWLINKQVLQATGGFEAFARSSLPERHLARFCARNKAYRFYISDASVGVSTVKTAAEQQATALRMRYPQLRRRPHWVALVSLAEFALFIMPLAMALAAIINHLWVLAATGLFTCLLLAGFYAWMVRITYRRILWGSLIAFPLAAFYDICILNYSMWLYEFNEVIWKGRNVCVPVMRVISDLPKVD